LVAVRRSAQSPASIFSEDESLRQHREKIRNHPKPGNGATKLQELVNLPFRAVFGFYFLFYKNSRKNCR